jgi:glycosyltransferase involved in cell wall biosynthesis
MTRDTLPLVTIGIPTYNRADDYLRQTLQSALDQTYQNVEIVVSDNCSTDDTESVVKSLSDSRTRYFRHGENIGANENFNFCLEQAEGDYFLLLHDDDLIDDDFVDACMKAANYDCDVGIIRTGTRTIDSLGKVLTESPNHVGGLSTVDFFRGWFAGKTVLYLCSTLLNTKRLRESGGFNSKHQLFQDVIAEVQLAAKFGRADVQDVKASFRKHAATRTFSHKVSAWCEDSLMLLDIMCDLVPEDAALVRREGIRFLSMLNYNRASAIQSPTQRLLTYLMVYRRFGYRYSPLYFSVYQENLRRVKSTARKLKRALASLA